jgi:hypothetical protein
MHNVVPSAVRDVLPPATRDVLPPATRDVLPPATRDVLPTATRDVLPTATRDGRGLYWRHWAALHPRERHRLRRLFLAKCRGCQPHLMPRLYYQQRDTKRGRRVVVVDGRPYAFGVDVRYIPGLDDDFGHGEYDDAAERAVDPEDVVVGDDDVDDD